MQNKQLNHTHNSLKVLDLIASKWTILVIHALRHETKRYSEISRITDGITEKVLTDVLKDLERNGIVARTSYPTIPPKVEYKLTELGSELLYITDVMAVWADHHFDAVELARSSYDTQKALN